MKKMIAVALAACAVAPVMAGTTNVGVSIGINQPGVYGRIDIGNDGYGQPQLVYPQPVIIAPPAVVYERRPIYLYVPPAHQHDWRHYCGRYQACGQPVYFVQEQWVRNRWQQEHTGNGRPGWDNHDDRDDDDHGHGKDKGKGKGKGHGKHGRD
ncbi:hypothetical protein [Aquabacterium sp.]|uniref:hypothetical protein n=1 Tax=Aquabacterium sp. TaxID=1872578 RepID=UPI0019ADAC5B|nr:hypothetical protein [Aquabacterium sp.]MBC7700483.1 hypothetical protein [Aquabacterium sp.]